MLLGYPLGSMIQNVFGIKKFQTQLPKLSRKISQAGGHFLVTNRNRPVFVTIPFEDYKEIEDVLLELNSPALQKEVKSGRKEYKAGKSSDFKKFVAKSK